MTYANNLYNKLAGKSLDLSPKKELTNKTVKDQRVFVRPNGGTWAIYEE